jgi:indole-3-glycerol phosphate synthase
VATYLERIVAAHRSVAASDDRPLEELLARATDAPPVRGFRSALVKEPELSIIAEIKRRSPSKGDLAVDLVPAELAKAYECGGAACLSVLTDEEFFGGSPEDLAEARAHCHLPVLRKDFTVCERDVVDARLMGADAVLLIVAALSEEEIATFLNLARELHMDALVEVHDEAELDLALGAGADLVGVNQRNLVTFEVDTGRASRLARLIPDDVVKVAESGLRGAEDAMRLEKDGYHAALVGESFVTAPDPGAAVKEMRTARQEGG